MSNRAQRRAAEHTTRKAEYKLQRTQAAVAAADLSVDQSALAEDPSEEMIDSHEEFIDVICPSDFRETSQAQINANRENAKLSTGATTPEGTAIVSENRRTHGLTGRFPVLAWEKQEDFQALAQSVYAEHNPRTDTECRLADNLIQHYWLKERAVHLQEELLANSDEPTNVDSKKLALFLRYQTTHERSYYKAQRELQNLQKAKRKEHIGFESQNRTQQSHEARVRLTHAKAMNLEIDTACRQVMEAPIPGNTRIPFEQLTKACSTAIATVVYQNQAKAAA